MADNFFFTGISPASDRRIQRQASAGKLRKLYAGIYTDNLSDAPSDVARRNAFKIAAHMCGPSSVMSGRSALEGGLTITEDEFGVQTGWLFLTDPNVKVRRDFNMPGLNLRTVPGPGPQPGDFPMLGLFMPSRARMLIENLAQSRSREGGGPTRTVGAEEVEKKLGRICIQEGEEELNRVRDEARGLASTLGLTREFQRLDAIIGALLGTRKSKLTTQSAQAIARGEPYDSDCVTRLLALRGHLEDVALPERPDGSTSHGSRVAACFIEAYFSNYIEGTRFPVRQAGRIVFENERPQNRPKDSHDVLATYNQLVNLGGRFPSSLSAREMIEEIRSRHADLMAARPEALPGEWKTDVNIAGNTTFVSPPYVPGTIVAGVDILSGLGHPFARAVFIQFMLSDIHPFADGNGRISRIMMTKELVGSGLSRIVIPTVYRDNYLGGLRTLTRFGNPAALVRAMDFCQKVTAACAASSVGKAVDVWASTFAFVEAGAIARLEMPDPARVITWNDEVPAPDEYWQA